MPKIEYSQPFGVTEEANIMKINFSNAISSFAGTSVVVSEKMEKDNFKEFLKLRDKWKNETLFVSSGTEIVNNGAYLKIISKGQEVIPWIFRELQHANDHWFVALESLTGANPINPEHIGDILAMKEDWLNWGEEQGLL